MPVTLGPHGSNFEDVVETLQGFIPLDQGLEVEIKGVKTKMCVFTLCFIGDMPQQQANAGFKSQRATLGCRFCFTDTDDRGDLNYDIVREGRYHRQTLQMRKEMDSLPTARDREKYGKKWGLNKDCK